MNIRFALPRIDFVSLGMAKTGRPPVKGQAWLDKFNEVVNREHRVGMAVIHTDMDLIEMVNWELPEEHQIAVATFKDYKSGDRGSDEFVRVFASLYKRALTSQRDSLFATMADEPPGAWQKWAWILERKFGDWNLRNVTVDETPDVKKLVFIVGDVAE